MFEIRNDPRKENRNFIRCFILYEFDFPSVVTSTVHLKMKYHSERGEVITIYIDLDNAYMCYKAFQKLESASILKGTVGQGAAPKQLVFEYSQESPQRKSAPKEDVECK